MSIIDRRPDAKRFAAFEYFQRQKPDGEIIDAIIDIFPTIDEAVAIAILAEVKETTPSLEESQAKPKSKQEEQLFAHVPLASQRASMDKPIGGGLGGYGDRTGDIKPRR